MPDGRIDGLSDACEIIRAKYIGLPSKQTPKNVFDKLKPRDFECIVERTFYAMGYVTNLTKYKYDGGRDVIAYKKDIAEKEHVLIECKLYNNKVGVSYIRALLGVVSDEKVNKGILITSGKFTKGAIDFAKRNPRIELIDGGKTIILMNKYLGGNWQLRIERIIEESIKGNYKQTA
jgi:restriction system protein